MRIRHALGTLAAALLMAVALPAASAGAATGALTWYTVGANTGSVDNPEPYLCYELADPEEPVTGGYNGTVFDARLYMDINCGRALVEVRAGDGYETEPVYSVKFYPRHATR
ncbi:hypothetical protein RM780_02810 [Streptomyces sp. DSM 44917]|uniref:Secreted protein n=1 Tax=Streptomyces boetiae TaxID=3075541 RepID=A0ABU2L3K1_9ACTN|nr:hypothetical protein [Streptomyces sp. DSM 44917]MDT0305893.1 hypothetical protein [Streptomyces sp. DSM 44917]